MKYPRIVEGLLVRSVSGQYGIYAHDRGIFAQRQYRKGDVVLRAHGTRLKGGDPRLTHRAVQIASNSFIEPKRYSGVWYLNHSCSPNCYVDMDAVIARREIAPGEEITVDYSLFIDYPSWDMDCACNAVNCRKRILPFRGLKRHDARYASSYLKKKD